MNKIIFVSFKNEKQALQGADALREVNTNTLYAGAVIARDATGKIAVRRSALDRPAATLGGLLLGSLVGLLGPAAVAIDSGSGALLGAAMDLAKAGITTEFVETIENELTGGKTGLIAELEEEWESPIDIRMEALGGTVFRQTRAEVEDAFFEKEIESYRAELSSLEREKLALARANEKQRSAERATRLQTKIGATKRKIQKKEEQLAARIRSVKKEGEKKIRLLEGQKASAKDEAKIELRQLLQDIRGEYRWRARKLSQALARSKKKLIA